MTRELPPPPRHRLAALAAQQHGHVAVWQARHLGISADALHGQAAAAGWTRVHRSVWRLAGVPPSRRGAMWAALLGVADLSVESLAEGALTAAAARSAIAARVAVTGWSAADIWGFDGHRPATVQLLGHAATTTSRRVRLIRSRRPIEPFVTAAAGLPIAKPWRAAWDAAHLVGRGEGGRPRDIADLLVNLDRRRVMSVDELLAVVDEPAAYGMHGQLPRTLRWAVESVRPGFSHSATEARARRIFARVCERAGLELHGRPLTVRDDAGLPIGEIDLAVASILYGIEVDGPHHREPRVRAHDRRRDQRLRTLRGWTITRYDVDLVDRGEREFERIVERDLRAFLLRVNAAAA